MRKGFSTLAWGSKLTATMNLPFPSPRIRRPSLPHPKRKIFATLCSNSTPVSRKSKVIVISGPTGAGKSRLALELAKRLDGEIISADSVQVYSGLDVGSAKPSNADRKEFPHHLLDILHPSQEYSAGQFYEDARKSTKEILYKGNVPVVAGGTGLYLRWYIYGKPDVPKSSDMISSEVCSELLHFQEKGLWEEAVEFVAKVGDPKARFLPCNNWYRLRRSLEIIKSSGSPPSAFQLPYNSYTESKLDRISDRSDPKEKLVEDLDYDFLCFFISSPRLELYRAIDLRCEEMLMETEGLLSEASWLLDVGLRPDQNSATRAIGYRQAMEFLLTCREDNGKSHPEDFYAFLSDFQKASRNFAKRQITWFRNEPIYHWLDASKPLEKVTDFICDAYLEGNEEIVVPAELAMKRDVSSRRETYELKSYHAQRRLFVRDQDCHHILEWIKRTQTRLVHC